ncbi:MAG: hypothetical protein ACJ0BL_06440 [Dehalococcoidia bacterium]
MELVRLSDTGNFLKAIIATMIALWMTVFITLQFVDANGSVRRYEIKQIGGHEIGLGTVPASPTVGVVHFVVYVKDLETEVSYMDAEVSFAASAPYSQNPDIGPISMINTVMDPAYYELNTSLDEEGMWFIVIEFQTPSGKNSVNYQINIQQPNPILPILTVSALLAVLVIMGVSARAWVKEYRKNSYTRKNKK